MTSPRLFTKFTRHFRWLQPAASRRADFPQREGLSRMKISFWRSESARPSFDPLAEFSREIAGAPRRGKSMSDVIDIWSRSISELSGWMNDLQALRKLFRSPPTWLHLWFALSRTNTRASHSDLPPSRRVPTRKSHQHTSTLRLYFTTEFLFLDFSEVSFIIQSSRKESRLGVSREQKSNSHHRRYFLSFLIFQKARRELAESFFLPKSSCT